MDRRHVFAPYPSKPGCMKCPYGESSPIHMQSNPKPLPNVADSFTKKADK